MSAVYNPHHQKPILAINNVPRHYASIINHNISPIIDKSSEYNMSKNPNSINRLLENQFNSEDISDNLNLGVSQEMNLSNKD